MKNNIWKKKDGFLKVLAPMAGYTDSAFRQLCRLMGADLVVSELISADAIAYNKFKVKRTKLKTIVTSSNNSSTAEMLSFTEAERPFVVQLFGKYPEKFGLAAKWVTENLHPDGIDINMGCPARKVVGSDHGAALLKKPALAVEIVKAVKENTNLPVSVKTRLGWDSDDEILEFAPLLISAGIDAITIHGRTYKNAFSGTARWENIYKVKSDFGKNISVIGNGDVGKMTKVDPTSLSELRGAECLMSKVDPTSLSEFRGAICPKLDDKLPISNKNCKLENENLSLDGIAVGRAAFGNPWIFSSNSQFSPLHSPNFTGQAIFNFQTDAKSLAEYKQVVLRHAQLAYESKGEHGLIEFRKHLLVYLKGFPEAKKLRLAAVSVKSVEDVGEILGSISAKAA